MAHKKATMGILHSYAHRPLFIAAVKNKDLAGVHRHLSDLKKNADIVGIDKALEEISQNKGILYDPEVADACLRLFKRLIKNRPQFSNKR